jgi:ABC-type protease/lipase transport system fused ATPase/permease subunit
MCLGRTETRAKGPKMSDEPVQVKARISGLLSTTFFFSVFTNLLMLTGPLFMLQVYDRVLASRSEETLVALFALVGLLYFFYWLIEFARGRVVSRVGARLQDALNAPVFRAILDRSARRVPEKRGSLQDIEALRGLFSSPVILALFDIPWTPVFLAAIFIFIRCWAGWRCWAVRS